MSSPRTHIYLSGSTDDVCTLSHQLELTPARRPCRNASPSPCQYACAWKTRAALAFDRRAPRGSLPCVGSRAAPVHGARE